MSWHVHAAASQCVMCCSDKLHSHIQPKSLYYFNVIWHILYERLTRIYIIVQNVSGQM